MKTLSVIMPVYNGVAFLREAVASVLRSPLVSQLVVVDDGSTDETAAILRSFGARVISRRQENHGPAAARNAALEIASGELIGFLDADDLWHGLHPAAAMAELQKSGADLVFGETQCMSDDSALFGPRFHTFHLGSAICRRELFARAGKFNEAMRLGEDVDWFLRVRESGAAIVALEELSLGYRVHAGNRGRIHQSSRVGLLGALQRSLRRRKEAVA